MKKLVLLGVLGAVGIFGLIGKTDVLGISQVQVSGEELSCAAREEFQKDLNLAGQNIFLLNESYIKQRMLAKYPCLKDIKIARSFSRDVKVEVLARKPLARVAVSRPVQKLSLSTLEATPASTAALLDWSFPQGEGEDYYLIDEEGVIFARSESEEKFTFYLPEKLETGGRINSRLAGVLSILVPRLGVLEAIQASSSGVVVKADEETLLVKDGIKTAFSLKKDILPQLISLQLILQKAKIDERVVETVDLRFDKPVAIYGKRPSNMRN